MKRIIISILFIVFLSSCENRQATISRFQQAYPYTWQQELLHYDIQQTQQRQQAWRNMWNQINENQQRQFDRQYYSQPRFFPQIQPQQNQNYWQEQIAQQQYLKEQQQKTMLPIPRTEKPLPRMDFNRWPWKK